MAEQESALANEIRSIKEAYAALNRNDIPGFLRIFDPEILRVESILSEPTTYRGIEAVTAHVESGRGGWAEGSCVPERFMVAGDRVIVFVYVRVRLKIETEWREGRVVDIYTFRNGKAVEFRTFANERQALEWAGVLP